MSSIKKSKYQAYILRVKSKDPDDVKGNDVLRFFCEQFCLMSCGHLSTFTRCKQLNLFLVIIKKRTENTEK